MTELEPTEHPFAVGEVVVCDLHGDDDYPPVGRVTWTGERGFRLTLFDWFIGVFDGPDMFVAWRTVRRAQLADRDADGRWDMQPLAELQARWHRTPKENDTASARS